MQFLLIGAQQITTDGSPVLAVNTAFRQQATAIQTEAEGSNAKGQPRRILAATERGVGYTDGDSITTRGAYVGTAGAYNVAAMLTADDLSSYEGCKIVGIRFALSQSIGKTSAFLYRVVDGVASEIRTCSVRRTADGWNEVRFNSAQEYTINTSENLMYGFTYNETADMVQAGEGALCFYTPQSESSYASLIEKSDGFYSMSSLGNLCVQLIVDVSSLPSKAITMKNLLAGNKYHEAGSKVDAFVMYYNTGLEDISSMSIGYRIDDGETTFSDKTETLKTGASGSMEAEFTLPSDLASGKHSLKFFVDKIDGAAAPGLPTDTITDNFVVYRESKPRKQHYIEQFNTQSSYLGDAVNEQMNSGSKADSVVLVNIYRPGEPLAVKESGRLDTLYAYTHPCFTVDRFYMMGENYIAFDVNDYTSMLPKFWSMLIAPLVSEANANPCFATLNLQTAFDGATRKLTAKVSGETVDEFPLVMDGMALTLMITEDSVKGMQKVQSGMQVVTKKNYVHNNVLRSYVTAPTGDELTVSAGGYEATYEYAVPETWNADNLKVVALLTRNLGDVSDANILDADIINAAEAKVSDGTDGIQSVSMQTTHSAAADGYYTLGGVKLSGEHLSKGIYIVRSNGLSRKIVVR